MIMVVMRALLCFVFAVLPHIPSLKASASSAGNSSRPDISAKSIAPQHRFLTEQLDKRSPAYERLEDAATGPCDSTLGRFSADDFRDCKRALALLPRGTKKITLALDVSSPRSSAIRLDSIGTVSVFGNCRVQLGLPGPASEHHPTDNHSPVQRRGNVGSIPRGATLGTTPADIHLLASRIVDQCVAVDGIHSGGRIHLRPNAPVTVIVTLNRSPTVQTRPMLRSSSSSGSLGALNVGQDDIADPFCDFRLGGFPPNEIEQCHDVFNTLPYAPGEPIQFGSGRARSLQFGHEYCRIKIFLINQDSEDIVTPTTIRKAARYLQDRCLTIGSPSNSFGRAGVWTFPYTESISPLAPRIAPGGAILIGRHKRLKLVFEQTLRDPDHPRGGSPGRSSGVGRVGHLGGI